MVVLLLVGMSVVVTVVAVVEAFVAVQHEVFGRAA